jgi:hypothetical protein
MKITNYMINNARVQNPNTGEWETRFMLYAHDVDACDQYAQHDAGCWTAIAQSTSHDEIETVRRRHAAERHLFWSDSLLRYVTIPEE